MQGPVCISLGANDEEEGQPQFAPSAGLAEAERWGLPTACQQAAPAWTEPRPEQAGPARKGRQQHQTALTK